MPRNFLPPLRLTRVQLDSNQNKNWAKMENLFEFSDSHERCACLCIDKGMSVSENEKSMSECFTVVSFIFFLDALTWAAMPYFTRLRNEKFRKFLFFYFSVLVNAKCTFCLISSTTFILVRHDDLLAFVLSWLLAFFKRENVKIEKLKFFTAFLKIFHNFLLLYAGLWHDI